jgi:hypothetical protein
MEKQNGGREIIYILTNEAMPGYVKIGKTSTSLEQRIRELSSSTSVPLAFTCFYACTVKDMQFVERQLHDAFDNNRINPRREFFRIAPERVVAALKLAELEDITPKKDFVESPEDQHALDEARKRRAVFRFGLVNIPKGAVLTFTRDENVSCAVVDDRKVDFGGEVMSLSVAADRALRRIGVEWKSVQGPLYWKYDGETLDERRIRFEEGDEPTEEEIDAAGDRYIQDQLDQERGK